MDFDIPADIAAYLHELVHLVATGLPAGGARSYVISEGLAAWLGGSDGRTFPELLPFGTVSMTGPSGVGTFTLAPRTASLSVTGRSIRISFPSRR